MPRFEIPVVNDPGGGDGQRVPVAVRAEREAGVVAESRLAAGVQLGRSEFSVTLGATILQSWQAETISENDCNNGDGNVLIQRPRQ